MKRKTMTLTLVALAAMAAKAEAGEPIVQPPYSWRGIEGTGVFPAKDLVTTFCDYPAEMAGDPVVSEAVAKAKLSCKPGDRQNIVWRTLLPHWGHNAPVCVRDRVFVLCNEGWKSDAPLLVCMDVKNGKILWQEPVDHLDAWPADKAKVAKECRAKEIKRWRDHMRWWNRFYWDNEKHAAAAATRAEADWNRLVEEAKADGWLFPTYANRSLRYWPCDAAPGTVRGRYGLQCPEGKHSNAMGGAHADQEVIKNYERCVRERYYFYPGWTSEGPFFGSTMGSVVSDGKCVYAVTAQNAAAGFDLDGRRLWVTDLNGDHIRNYPASIPGFIANHMASPVLAGDLLVYYHRDDASMYGLETTTGKIVWRAVSPLSDRESGNWSHRQNRAPLGYVGHMGPGGTPVVMRLPDAKAGGKPVTVVVSGHGMVVRVSDGKMLGMVRMQPPAGAVNWQGKPLEEAEEADTDKGDAKEGGGPSSTYGSWTASGDTLYCQHHYGWVYAIKLAVDGDALKQEMLWRTAEAGGGKDPNLVYDREKLYCTLKSGFRALNATTGKEIGKGPRPGGNSTSLGFSDGKVVMRSSDKGVQYKTYTILNQSDLKSLGTGLLVQPKPEGEVAERHIAFLGTPYIAWGAAGITCWGNRIFIRSNDYLWCIGDPARQFVPPEVMMK